MTNRFMNLVEANREREYKERRRNRIMLFAGVVGLALGALTIRKSNKVVIEETLNLIER